MSIDDYTTARKFLVSRGKLPALSEIPFVRLMYFRTAKILLLSGRRNDRFSALIMRQLFKTCVPEAREKGWRIRVHTNVAVLCTVERANAVKAPASLKVKATDTGSHLSR